MTLRRCDSLPTRFRDTPVTNPSETAASPTGDTKIPDSNTVPNFTEPPARDQIVATWNSLLTDVKNIKNGFPVKNEPTIHGADKKEPITHNFIQTFACNNGAQRKNTYDNRRVGINVQEVDRCSSYPLDTGQPRAKVQSTSLVRRRTLLERLLPWRNRSCDCQEQCEAFRMAPKQRAEDLLCTCGVSRNRFKLSDECKTYAERGRSKSVGYEAAREVTQFRRLVRLMYVMVKGIYLLAVMLVDRSF